MRSADGLVDGPADRGWEGGQDDLAALAADPQHPVAVFLAEVGDVGAAGFEDPQAEQPEHGDQGEVVRVGRESGGGEHGFELQMGQPEGGRLGWHVRAADMVGRRGQQDPVDDAGAVEAGHHRQAAADGGGLEPADLLHPPHVQLDLRPRHLQRVSAALEAPGQVGARSDSAWTRRLSRAPLNFGGGLGDRQAAITLSS